LFSQDRSLWRVTVLLKRRVGQGDAPELSYLNVGLVVGGRLQNVYIELGQFGSSPIL
jgi:hypothetical protein